MHVKELKLQNFRGIKDLHLVFNSEHNIVVLVGVNGVGKSSILDCINLLIYYYKFYDNNIYNETYSNY
jgi:predicted ATP-dependent endonuclease of OLD family